MLISLALNFYPHRKIVSSNYIWGLLTICSCARQEVSTLSGHTSTVRCVKTVSSNLTISSSHDTNIRIWNIPTGECEGVLEGHLVTVRSLAIHNDVIVSGGFDGTARIWSLEKKECLYVLKGHEGRLYSVVCDGRRSVTAGLDREVRVWDIQSGYVFLSFLATGLEFLLLL